MYPLRRWVFMLILAFPFAGCNAPPEKEGLPLEEKLSEQFRLFDHAREDLIRRIGREGKTFSREDWEQLLSPRKKYRLNSADLEALRADQRRRILESARAADSESVIDMRTVRERGWAKDFCAAIPKGGLLHVHPNGSLHRQSVLALLEETNPRLDFQKLKRKLYRNDESLDPGELDFLKSYDEGVRYRDLGTEDRERLANLFVLPPGIHPIRRFAIIFEITSLLRDNPAIDYWERLYGDFARNAKNLGLRYVEFTKGIESLSRETARLEKCAASALAQHGVVFRWNAAFARDRGSAQNLKRLEELLDPSYSPLILGMDMLGEEERLPALESGQEIYACVLAEIENGKSRIHRTIHAAGLGEVRNIRDAMIMGAERIGHATRIMEDPVALEYAARRHQPVEVNLVSNVRLGYAKDYESHPFLNMLRLGLRVSLSTDDEGILDTDIVNEYLKAVTHSDVTYNELKQMTFNSIETSFAEPELREKLLADLKKDFDNFEREWSLKAGRPQSAPAGADLPAGAN